MYTYLHGNNDNEDSGNVLRHPSPGHPSLLRQHPQLQVRDLRILWLSETPMGLAKIMAIPGFTLDLLI